MGSCIYLWYTREQGKCPICGSPENHAGGIVTRGEETGTRRRKAGNSRNRSRKAGEETIREMGRSQRRKESGVEQMLNFKKGSIRPFGKKARRISGMSRNQVWRSGSPEAEITVAVKLASLAGKKRDVILWRIDAPHAALYLSSCAFAERSKYSPF